MADISIRRARDRGPDDDGDGSLVVTFEHRDLSSREGASQAIGTALGLERPPELGWHEPTAWERLAALMRRDVRDVFSRPRRSMSGHA